MKRVVSDWTDVVLVCRKCSKKLKGGFGPKGNDNLIKALRKEAARSVDASGKAKKCKKAGKPKRRNTRIAVLEADCFDICPKNAAIVINAKTPDLWRVVPSGVETTKVFTQLGINQQDSVEAA